MTLDGIIDRIMEFRADREWEEFHTPENLAKAISIEANELLEHYLWEQPPCSFGARRARQDEVADVLIYALYYCMSQGCENGADVLDLIQRKIDKNEAKYPVNRGSHDRERIARTDRA